jgi:hypothetical protein
MPMVQKSHAVETPVVTPEESKEQKYTAGANLTLTGHKSAVSLRYLKPDKPDICPRFPDC